MTARHVPGEPCQNGHVASRNARGKCIKCVSAMKVRAQRRAPKWLRDSGNAWIKTSWRGLKKRKENGQPCASMRELLALWLKQKGRCALTGLPIVGRAELDHKTAVSKGGAHTIENLQWTDQKANASKRDGSDSDFQEWVLAAAKSITRVRRLEQAIRDARQQGLFP